MSSLHRVVRIPELLMLICRYSESTDDFNLLRVSRSFYKAMIPIAWDEIEGVEKVLSLIPEIQCTRGRRSKVLRIDISGERFNLQRFNLYAPYVRNLDIYAGNTVKHEIPNWPYLVQHARNQAFLPNLVCLNMAAEETAPSGQEMMWTQVFLSPTLLEISLPPPSKDNEGLASHREASALLRYIICTCPSLQRLSIFPDHELAIDYKQRQFSSSALMDLWDSLPQQFRQLTCLQELESTTEALTPGIIMQLAQLPSLERLKIYSTFQLFETERFELTPRNSFSALRKFELMGAPYTDFPQICKFHIFEWLTFLALFFKTRLGTLDAAVDWATSLMVLISDNCPSLYELIIDFDDEEIYGDLDISPESILSPMKKLPLQKLDLRYAILCSNWELIPQIWGKLKVLKLHRQQATPKELIWFSKLPALESLVVSLSLGKRLPKLDHVASKHPNLHFCTLRSPCEADIDGDIYVLARWLLSLWPGLKSVVWADDWDSDYDSEYQPRKPFSHEPAVKTAARTLSSILVHLRELAKTKSRLAAEAYGEDALELFSEGP